MTRAPAKASRVAFGDALLELGARDERIVTLDADLSKSTMTARFAKTYPARAFDLGIAESNMIGVAAGLALAGQVPFACSFACFLVGRFETIRVSIAYTRAPVKLVGTHVGVAIGEDGYSQMGLEDLACLRALPNIPIVQPADEIETRQAVAYAVDHPGPIYLRLTRQNLEAVHDSAYRFQLGRAEVLRPGHDVTILASGGPLWNAVQAAERLAADGVEAEVVNVSTIKPLDEETILGSAGKTGRVMTVEDHSVDGGLGSATAELLCEQMPTPLRRIGIHGFGESGDPKGLYAKHGLDVDGTGTSDAGHGREAVRVTRTA
jgi:transketolase